MSLSRQELQATQRILSLLESSKARSETLLDELPGVFVVIDRGGGVHRGNQEAAGLQSLDFESLPGTQFSGLFSMPVWKRFESELDALSKHPGITREFELPLRGVSGRQDDSIPYFWHVRTLNTPGSASLPLYCVSGKNISELRAMQQQLDVTAAVQALFLPAQNTLNPQGLKVSAQFSPAEFSGGDWWWCEPMRDGTTMFLLGDVTGHGAGSAMITAAVASAFQTFVLLSDSMFDPQKLLESLNTVLLRVASNRYHMTLAAVQVDASRQKLKFWSAGAPPFFIQHKNGEIETVLTRSSPLGSKPFVTAAGERDLKSSDRICLFTDGLFDFTDSSGKNFGLRRLRALIGGGLGKDVAVATRQLVDEIRSFQKDPQKQEDDIAVIFADCPA